MSFEMRDVLEGLPNIEGVNWKYAALYLPNKKLLLLALRDFYNNIDSAYQELSDLAERADDEMRLADYRLRVHALKSTSALVGILSVSELAKILETAAKNGNGERVRVVTPVLLEELQKMKECIQPFIEETIDEEVNKKPFADAEKLFNFFEMLRFSMKQMDISGTDACMDQILAYSYDAVLQEAVDWIGEDVKRLDYEEAEKEIERVCRSIMAKQ